MANAEEFNSFVDESTSFYLVNLKDVRDGKEHDQPLEEHDQPLEPSQPAKIPRKFLRWIKRKCPELLREIGKPAYLEPFKIDTGDAEPIKISPRPHSPLDLEKIKAFIDENLKNGVISESESPWSFPLVLAAKPNGGTRICVDYRALNRITKKDAHPLPRIDESLIKFFGMRYFSSIDLRSGYWQIILNTLSRPKTAFSSRYGHYEWNVIPFGLSNAPGAFQRRMNRVLHKYIDKFCIVYLDDILIYSKTQEEHERHVKTILKALDRAGMVLNLEKCKFFAQEIRFLGHIIDKDGSKPDPHNIEKILNWPTPRNITDTRGFVNLAGNYRKYIKSFAKIAEPLTDLMKGSPLKGTPIKWGEREEESFQALKKAISSEPVLRHPQIGKPCWIDPDASQYAIGAQLQQLFLDTDGKSRLHPIAFLSKKLTETEQRYSSQERELLAAKYALDHWRHLIEGSEINIRTDHESLKTYRTKNPMAKRVVRFLGDIEHFDPKITYRPGPLQKVPDALSRMPGLREEGEPADSDQLNTVEVSNNAQTEPITTRHTRMDRYQKLRKYLKAYNIVGKVDNDLKEEASQYTLRDDKLYHQELNTPVIVTLDDLKAMIKSVHKDLGHYGRSTTLDAVRKRYKVASELWEEGKKVLDSCIPCQLYKNAPNTTNTATIHPYGTKNPFELWEIDFVGPLEKTPRQMEYLITAIDYCTSKTIAYPLTARSAEAAIEVLEEIVWTYGKPSEIITDNGEEFRSKKFQAVRKRYDIHHNRTSPGHPQTNGKVERLNHELVQRLQRISAENDHQIKDWDLYLRQALFAFQAHTNTRLGATPFFLQYGTEPILPSTSIVSNPVTRVEIEEATEHRRKHVQDLSKYRTDAAKKYQEALETLARTRDNSSSSDTPILTGDLVMRLHLNRKSKLHPKWDGPFVVLDSSSKDVYQLGTLNGHTLENLVNKQRLRKLDANERKRYTGDFWEASSRLKLRDKRARHQNQLRELETELAKATIESLAAQKQGRPHTLEKHHEIGAKKQELQKILDADDEVNPTTPPVVSDLGKRMRRIPIRYQS